MTQKSDAELLAEIKAAVRAAGFQDVFISRDEIAATVAATIRFQQDLLEVIKQAFPEIREKCSDKTVNGIIDVVGVTALGL